MLIDIFSGIYLLGVFWLLIGEGMIYEGAKWTSLRFSRAIASCSMTPVGFVIIGMRIELPIIRGIFFAIPLFIFIGTYIIHATITNLRSTGRFRHVNKFYSERLAIVMEDERWKSIANSIMSKYQSYHKQINCYKVVHKKLGKHWHRRRYHIKSGKFNMRCTVSKDGWHPSLRLRVCKRHRLILSIKEINERGKVIYADLNYLPDWATFPAIIDQATEQLHDQTEILQGKLDDRTYQQHQDKQGFKDYVSALADVFIDKT